MRPVAVELVADRFVITHRCEACGHTKRNRAGDDDGREALLDIVRGQNRAVTNG